MIMIMTHTLDDNDNDADDNDDSDGSDDDDNEQQQPRRELITSFDMQSVGLLSVQRSLGLLFDNVDERKRFSDFKFQCGNKIFDVHSLILKRSEYFKTMFAAGLTETKERMVTIEDVEPSVVGHLLRFLYTDKLTIVTALWR